MPKEGPHTLYPTIAISDAFNAAGHIYGAYLCMGKNPMAAMGLSYVALAALVGVFRFGFDKQRFMAVNGGWAELAGFVGLPMCGHDIIVRRLLAGTSLPSIVAHPAFYMSVLVLIFSAVQAIWPNDEKKRSGLRTLVAAAGFLVPSVYESVVSGNQLLGSSVLLFAFAGIVIGADRERFLLGVRRENWFHYLITIAAVGIGLGLSK